MKLLLRRALSIYRNNGPIDFARATKRFVVHGSLRDELLNAIPRSEQLLRRYISLGHRLRPLHYTDADPFKTFWIDPNEIIYDVYHTDLPLRFGRVYGGSWDQTDKRFTDRPVYQCFSKHFEEGLPWEETVYYQKKYQKLQQGRSIRGCTTIEDLPRYFAQFDRLYKKINEEGYKTQAKLLQESPKKTIAKNLDAPFPKLNEIGICIGRSGGFYRGYRGEHRLAIAKLSGIDQVPVQVIVRHREWHQKRLSQIDLNEGENIDHPDLRN